MLNSNPINKNVDMLPLLPVLRPVIPHAGKLKD